jgi:DNA-binding CsgD family transcriptional regulator
MAVSKPTLGHASRTDAVLALRHQGLTTRQIGERIGIADSTVTALEHSAGRAKQRAARPAERNGRTILFPRDILAALGPHAAKRGIHPNTLARLIVSTVVDECLIDSVLDDQEDWHA